ncbi:MAG: Type 1 glutamine amidotransferase-like domain-containing protein [Candidatus Saccharimonadales bacterium]
MNALDFSIDLPRVAQRLEDEIKGLAALGFMAEQLDLRNYFDNGNLAEVLKNYDMVWITGGNTFILAKAFRQSGFDKVFEDLVASGQLVYGGYSAAFCVLAKSLHGIELVDDKDAEVESYESGEVWEGLGVIDFHPIVHFRSNHHESDDVEKEYEYVVKNKIPHKTFKDGDVYLVNGDQKTVLSE